MKAEITKRRETEIAKLQRELDETQAQNDVQLATYRKKHQDAVNQLTEQIDKMHAAKQRSEYHAYYTDHLSPKTGDRRASISFYNDLYKQRNGRKYPKPLSASIAETFKNDLLYNV